MSVLRRGLGILAAGLLGLLAVFAGLAVLAFAVLQTQAARDALVDLLEQQLSTPGERTVAIGRLDGPLPQRFHLKDVDVSDEEGILFSIAELTLEWRPLALLSGRLQIGFLRASQLDLERLPEGDSPELESDESPDLSFPPLPVDVVVQEVAVDRLRLGDSVLGTPAAFRFKASAAAYRSGPARAMLHIERSDHGDAEISAAASYNPSDSTLEIDLQAAEPAGGLLAQILERPGLPAMSAKLSGSGPLLDWDGQLNASIEGMASLETTLSIDGLEPYGLGVKRSADVTDLRLEITQLTLQGMDTTLSGEATVPLDGTPIEARVHAEVGSFAAYSKLAGLDLGGALELDLRLRADGARQIADLTASARNISARTAPETALSIDQVDVKAQLTDLMQRPSGTATLAVGKLGYKDVRLDRLRVRGNGDPAAARVEVSAAGNVRGPLDLDMAAAFKRDDSVAMLSIDRLKGTAAGRPIALRQPLLLRQGPNSTAVQDLALDLDGGRVAGSVELGTSTIDGTITVSKLPLSLVAIAAPDLNASGQLDADARVQGSVSRPRSRVQLQVTDVRIEDQAASELPPLNGQIAVELEGGQLTLAGKVTGFAENALTMTAEVPFRLSVEPFSVSLPESEKIRAHLAWRGEIEPLTEFVPPLAGNRLAGRVDVDLKANGTLATPDVSGRATWTDGEFENFEAGTLLQGIDLTIAAENRRVELVRLEANDGGSGQLSARGFVNLEPEGDKPLELDLTIDQATLVRRDDLRATATGQLGVTGTLDEILAQGRIETDSVEVSLVSNLPPQVVTLDVVEADESGREAETNQAESQATGEQSMVRLDLTLTLPRRVFVRGRGLDSEWGGEFHITGTANNPVIEGALRPIRGELGLTGKVFELQEGSVQFTGGNKIDPEVDLSLVYEGSDFTALIRVHGLASRPEVSLSSVPELPRDEVLSRILFDKATGELSALEAAQLAQSVVALTGAGGGPGILDKVRTTLGLDVVRVGSGGEDDGPTLGLGKYLTDDVYIGVEQGTTPGSTAGTIEVEITPNITLESDVGAAGKSRVGVQWKWDY